MPIQENTETTFQWLDRLKREAREESAWEAHVGAADVAEQLAEAQRLAEADQLWSAWETPRPTLVDQLRAADEVTTEPERTLPVETRAAGVAALRSRISEIHDANPHDSRLRSLKVKLARALFRLRPDERADETIRVGKTQEIK
jgi:hypothetical protein